MCTASAMLADGTEVGCRECWQCRERKVDDWVGRCIAESKSAVRTFSITLTYGRDEFDEPNHIRASVLTYSDVQKYLKRLRFSGYVVRYLAVGEYGSTKGRAHWHAILFFHDNALQIARLKTRNAKIRSGRLAGKLLPVPAGPVPDHEISTRGVDGHLQDVRFSDRHWQHGHAVWEELREEYDMAAVRAVRYVCKYLLKDADDDAAQMVGPRMSKKPPLGDAWLQDRARQYVRQGLAPQDLFYSFPDVRSKDGSLKRFRLAGVSADNYLAYYCEALTGEQMPVRPLGDVARGARERYEEDMLRWIKAAYDDKRRPNSELVEEWLDALLAPLWEAEKWRDKVRGIVRAKYATAVRPGTNFWSHRRSHGQAE